MLSATDEANLDGSLGENLSWRVRGDELSGAGLWDGDMAVIRPSATPPAEGEAVLALLPDGRAVLCRGQARGEAVTLEGLTLRADEVRMWGVLVSVVRGARPRRVRLP